MRAGGMSHDEIAVEFARRYHYRPRAAHRHARGWTQDQAADHINAHAARSGLDPDGTAPMTSPKLSEVENWPLPNNRRRPTPQILALLAEVYGTSVQSLIDLDDREQLPPADLLLINLIETKGVPASAVGSSTRGESAKSEVAPMVDAPSRQQVLLAASALGVAAVLPRSRAVAVPFPAARSSVTPVAEDPLADLREAVTVPAEWSGEREPGADALAEVDARARECHRRYQQADYDGTARLLPAVVRDIEALSAYQPAGADQQRMRRTQAVAYIAAAKLATKSGAHDLAWLAADRGQHAALAADAPALLATARRQIACVFHDQGRLVDAERVALAALDAVTRRPGEENPRDLASARGALLLLAAVTAVRQGERTAARRRLAAAAEQAAVLGQDDNRLWSAFGPTNVAIHSLTAALAFDDPTEAVDIGTRIDTRLLPSALAGRRARLHVDLADGHVRLGDDQSAAVHILEVARSAPQLLRVDPAARTLLTALIGRARGSTAPVLRSVAEQAGLPL
ncbi:helix-turn-helix transcriptional regulator [Frankia sp. KB5]|uniref:helix-turn-helix domain-containing protein n=1 Tax=Frankia sp. KB5 TaxID=683318 RepID=UPI001F52DE6D|nr:helix-turn-helix transcriptional regulator [Frankia sp. KB5]